MTDAISADEKPKRKTAKRVVAEKRQYFVPKHGVSVEASDPVEAAEKAAAQAEQPEEGDE